MYKWLILFILTITLIIPILSATPMDENLSNYMVVGDAYRIEFFSDMLGKVIDDYGLEALHNTVQAWIGYSEWAKYPDEWNNIRGLVSEAHKNHIPVGVTYGFHVSDSANIPYDTAEGFLYYYKTVIPRVEWWRYPNGSVAEDPYTVGVSRTFTGALAVRVLSMYGRVDFYCVMQPQNPYWYNFFLNWGKRAIDAGADSIFIDGPDAMFVFFWGGGFGDTSTWEGYYLKQYLESIFTPDELEALGVKSLNNFSLSNYLSEKYRVKAIYSNYMYVRERFKVSWPIETVVFANVSAILEDPIFKESLIYWYKSMINFTKNMVADLKEYARSKGRNVTITVNEYFAWIPHVTLTPYVDIMYVETNQFNTPPYQTNNFIIKLAKAAGNYTKRVWIGEWILHFSNPYYPEKPPNDISNLVKIKIAEAYSNGALMLVPFGTGSPEEGWPPKRLVTGIEREKVSKYYRFIRDNEWLFKNTYICSKVAILASLGTEIWGFIPAFNVYESSKYQKELWGWAKCLEYLNIPYDVLLLGFKGLMGTDAIHRLNQYDVIIAPMLTHISDEQLNALKEFVNQGGVLITTRDIGLFDEMNNRRSIITLKWLYNSDNVIMVESELGHKLFTSLENRVVDEKLLNKMAQYISMSGLENNVLVHGNYDNIYVNLQVYRDSKGAVLFMINYNYNYSEEKDEINVLRNLEVTLKLPHVRPGKVMLYSPDLDEPIELKYEQYKDYMLIKIPKLEIWDIIVILDESYLVKTKLSQLYKLVLGLNTLARKINESAKVKARTQELENILNTTISKSSDRVSDLSKNLTQLSNLVIYFLIAVTVMTIITLIMLNIRKPS